MKRGSNTGSSTGTSAWCPMRWRKGAAGHGQVASRKRKDSVRLEEMNGVHLPFNRAQKADFRL